MSGDTSRHLWRMADAILRQVRMRKLLKAASFKNGVEGDRVDGWNIMNLSFLWNIKFLLLFD